MEAVRSSKQCADNSYYVLALWELFFVIILRTEPPFRGVWNNLSGVDLNRALRSALGPKLPYARITQLLSQSPKSDFNGVICVLLRLRPPLIRMKAQLYQSRLTGLSELFQRERKKNPVKGIQV